MAFVLWVHPSLVPSCFRAHGGRNRCCLLLMFPWIPWICTFLIHLAYVSLMSRLGAEHTPVAAFCSSKLWLVSLTINTVALLIQEPLPLGGGRGVDRSLIDLNANAVTIWNINNGACATRRLWMPCVVWADGRWFYADIQCATRCRCFFSFLLAAWTKIFPLYMTGAGVSDLRLFGPFIMSNN